eukprot:5596429-Alexandrium_andersonii.AAC.1
MHGVGAWPSGEGCVNKHLRARLPTCAARVTILAFVACCARVSCVRLFERPMTSALAARRHAGSRDSPWRNEEKDQ